jgi:hypothetical protein
MARPLAPLKTYNLKDQQVIIIGGVLIGGYGKEGGIAYEYPSDRYQDDVGADGQVTVSRLNDERVYVTITLMENSPAYKELMSLLRLQEIQAKTPLGVLPMPYLHQDFANGDNISSAHCVFLTQPQPSKVRTVGEVEFKLLLPNAAKNMVLAVASF